MINKISILFLALHLPACGWSLKKGIYGGKEEGSGNATEVPKPHPENDPASFKAQLVEAQTCEQVRDYVVKSYMERIAKDFEWQKYYYARSMQDEWDESIIVADDAPNTSSAGGDGADGSGSAGNPAPIPSSAPEAAKDSGSPTAETTNNQTKGVEEDDLFKATQTHIFKFVNNELKAVQINPANALKEVGALKLEGSPFSMLLAEQKLVVFSYGYSEAKPLPDGGIGVPGGGAAEPMPMPASDVARTSDPAFPGGMYQDKVLVHVVDVSNPAALKLLKSHELKGGFVTSRRIGNTVRVVHRPSFQLPPELVRYLNLYNVKKRYSIAEVDAMIAEALAKNEKLLTEWTVKDFLGGDEAFASSCIGVLYPNVPVNSGLISVASISLANDGLEKKVIIGEPNIVYASATSLFISTLYPSLGEERYDHSYIHKFDISQEGTSIYKASGSMKGQILNQFSMDEDQGILRVAVTERTENWNTINRVRTMKEEAAELKIAGETEGLANGERIFSARFIGNRGYVVTFRQVDPLYVLDLSDAAQPKVLGELKIPGVSTYIHPMGEGRLLTVGRDERWSVKISIFDVANDAEPKELDHYIIPNSSSEAQYNHKAFYYNEAKGILALSVQGYDSQEGKYLSTLKLFNIDRDKGVSLRGGIAWQKQQGYNGRSFILSDIIYGVSSNEVFAASLVEPELPILGRLGW